MISYALVTQMNGMVKRASKSKVDHAHLVNIYKFLCDYGVGRNKTMFMTLTFAKKLYDKSLASGAWAKLRKFISSASKRKKFLEEYYKFNSDKYDIDKMSSLSESAFNFVITWEKHKDGAWHAHLVISIPNWSTSAFRAFLKWCSGRVGARKGKPKMGKLPPKPSVYRREGSVEWTQVGVTKSAKTVILTRNVGYSYYKLDVSPEQLKFMNKQCLNQCGDIKDEYKRKVAQIDAEFALRKKAALIGFTDVCWTYCKDKKGNKIIDFEGHSVKKLFKAFRNCAKYLTKYITKSRETVHDDNIKRRTRLISFSQGFEKASGNKFSFYDDNFAHLSKLLTFCNDVFNCRSYAQDTFKDAYFLLDFEHKSRFIYHLVRYDIKSAFYELWHAGLFKISDRFALAINEIETLLHRVILQEIDMDFARQIIERNKVNFEKFWATDSSALFAKMTYLKSKDYSHINPSVIKDLKRFWGLTSKPSTALGGTEFIKDMIKRRRA